MFKNLKNDIRLFQVFYVVAKTGSVSKASKLLYISQPAVSYHIKVLEENFNAKLFYRTTHGVVLTPLGETIFPYVEAGYNSFIRGEEKRPSIIKLDGLFYFPDFLLLQSLHNI